MYFAIYNEKTKEFENIEEGSINPIASEREGKPVYLIPANSTEIIPNKKQGYANVWNGNSWDLLEDNRGVEYWLSNETYYDKPHVMKELGKLPDGATTTRPEKPEITPTKEDIERQRAYRYRDEVDPMTAEINRLRDEEQTSEVITRINELILLRKEKVAKIKSDLPYITENKNK